MIAEVFAFFPRRRPGAHPAKRCAAALVPDRAAGAREVKWRPKGRESIPALLPSCFPKEENDGADRCDHGPT